ncbi:HAMP domain-containing sensor histidine kinase [Stappia sp. ES.058]|uniref:sensor histidine kinase n=1 Tax=Stappia sp. ES.058 TaxID=1881061 RepID=UPI0008797CF1|nr:HAMP domain-containing sensor histidine kinase [Stappia sp. ES.058]SDT89317.1 Signal transduction histidine kinase [Stappia sp. ES.058]
MSVPGPDDGREAGNQTVALPDGRAGGVARRRWGGLSGKLLLLTVVFVMLSEVLIFVPSVANFRNTWLIDKLTISGVAASILVETDMVAPGVQAELLRTTGAVAIALDDGNRRRLIAMSGPPGPIGRTVDMSEADPLTSIVGSFQILVGGGEGNLRVVGPSQMGLGGRVDIVMPEALLRDAMLAFSVRILALSAVISAITATLVYLSLRWLFVRPMQKLTRSMARFQESPDDRSLVIAPSSRNDEIGDAQVRLADMQTTLALTLQQQRRLADLGLAVSKINHDLRNILASAQLFSERLEHVADPTVQRLVPKIIATLDRAVSYTQSVLAYGSAREAPLKRRLVRLDMIVADVVDVFGLSGQGAVEFETHVPQGAEIDADPEQLFRVLMNLCRNAVQVLEANTDAALVRRVTIEAECGSDGATIRVSDTGPGIPPAVRDRLFKPFQSVAKSGGTGLGLAIAAELVRAHGGSIRLVEAETPGAAFEIRLPAGAGERTRVVKAKTGGASSGRTNAGSPT